MVKPGNPGKIPCHGDPVCRAVSTPVPVPGQRNERHRLRATATEWADWISEYLACYDAIKAASPQTTVFTTFQLERMKGLGVKNGWNDAQHWEIIADFGSRLDAVGFTTYPYFQYETPQEIPFDYYNEIRNY